MVLMVTTNLKSIRWESVKVIFQATSAAEQISRAQLADSTGLSLVTVGKVADSLLAMGVLTQEKQVKNTAGRRAGLLQIHPDKFALLLDISCRPFRFSVLDLRLNLRDKVILPLQETHSVAEELHTLLDEALSYVVSRYDLSDCFGIGVSLPGRYDPVTDRVISSRLPALLPGLENIALRATIEAVFSGFPLYLEASENAAALSHIVSIENAEQKNVLYWFLGEEVTNGAFLADGQFLHGRMQPCQFDKLLLADGRLLGNALRDAYTPKELVDVITVPLCELYHLLAPDTIILDCERLRCDPDAREAMLALLTETLHAVPGMDDAALPEFRITCAKFRHAHRGLAMHLREMWLYGALED